MSENDRPKQPRGRSYMEGDQERIGRRTPPKGNRIPVEIDSELTPPPMNISDFDPDTLSGDKEKLDFLYVAVKKQAEGLERVWGNRHNSQHIEAVRFDVNELTKSVRDFLLPAIKTVMGRVTNMEQIAQEKHNREQTFYTYEWPSFQKTFDQMVTNTERVGKDIDRIEQSVKDIANEHRHHVTTATQQHLELKKKDDDQESRLRKLEDFMLEWKVKVGVYSAGLSGIVALGAWIINKYF